MISRFFHQKTAGTGKPGKKSGKTGNGDDFDRSAITQGPVLITLKSMDIIPI
jgi:hypothetical protein